MESNEIHPALWHACSGLIRLGPILSSTVYYFPQGHVENYGGSASPQALCANFPATKCRVLSLKFLADPATDEVFARIRLKPMLLEEENAESSRSKEPANNYINSAWLKRLESSDISGDRCSLTTEQCLPVDRIFEKNTHIVIIHDIHNSVWRFEHTYDNASSSHSLTDGWRCFVSSKKLHAGDYLCFLKTEKNVITVGIRRSDVAINLNDDPTGFFYNIRNEASGNQIGRTGNGLCSVESLGQAMANAFKNVEFEAVYYPMVGKSSYFYDSNAVDTSWSTKWVTGMKVRKNVVVENQLGRRITHYGFITDIRDDPSLSWKHLKVKWEEADAAQVENCWEIEPYTPTVPTQKRGLEESEEIDVKKRGKESEEIHVNKKVRESEEIILFGQKISTQ